MSDLAIRKLAVVEPSVVLNIIAEGLDNQEVLSYLRNVEPMMGSESAARAVLFSKFMKSPRLIENYLNKLRSE